MSLEECLPAELRGPSTTITRIAAGLSGAGVHRVEKAGASFVLKVAGEDEPLASWRTKLDIRQRAGAAGLAPRVVHVDEARRAVLTAFVADRSFPALYGDPRTREVALALLGRTLRRVHALPLPPQAEAKDPRDYLAELWSGPLAGFALPAFVAQAIQDILAETAPAPGRAPVLSHNDVNPTNLVYDGENLLLLDWDTAGPNDPFYDLAAASVFLRLDCEARRTLFAAYEGEPVAVLPERFGYNRRLAALLCGAMLLHLARRGGHAGGGETLDTTLSLGDFYQRLRAGALTLAEAEGQWVFGLALVREGLAP